jgi:hypothetical protein
MIDDISLTSLFRDFPAGGDGKITNLFNSVPLNCVLFSIPHFGALSYLPCSLVINTEWSETAYIAPWRGGGDFGNVEMAHFWHGLFMRQ